MMLSYYYGFISLSVGISRNALFQWVDIGVEIC